MGRRESLEHQEELVRKRIENAKEETPKELLEEWHRELDNISFDLNNMYDNLETQTE